MSKYAFFRKGFLPIAAIGLFPPPPPSTKGALADKTVFFKSGDTEVAGLVTEHTKGRDTVEVRLAVPSPDGILMVGDQTMVVKVSDLTEREAVFEQRKLAEWTSQAPLEEAETKAFAVKNEGVIVDYQDVSFRAYASTFKHVTERDRVGDYVLPGAFRETIADFKKNPVMLVDHVNSVRQIAGSYADIVEDQNGLKVMGRVSNAPGLSDIRFLLAEKHLRTLSIGGIFIYLPDGFGIEKVYLFETSLVAIPANPDALIDTRSITIAQAEKAFRLCSRLHRAS